MKIHFLIALFVTIIVGCSSAHDDPRLDVVACLAETEPAAALDSLRSIDYGNLSLANRHFMTFCASRLMTRLILRTS